jgi:hypothetical protein
LAKGTRQTFTLHSTAFLPSSALMPLNPIEWQTAKLSSGCSAALQLVVRTRDPSLKNFL